MKKVISILLTISLLLGSISCLLLFSVSAVSDEQKVLYCVKQTLQDAYKGKNLTDIEKEELLNHPEWRFQYNKTANSADGWTAFDIVKLYNTVSISDISDVSLGYCINDGVWKIDDYDNINNKDWVYANVWYAKESGTVVLNERPLERKSGYENITLYYRLTVNGAVAWGNPNDENGWWSVDFSTTKSANWEKDVTFDVKTGDIVRFELKADTSANNSPLVFWSNPQFNFTKRTDYPEFYSTKENFQSYRNNNGANTSVPADDKTALLNNPNWSFQYRSENVNTWNKFNDVKQYYTISLDSISGVNLGLCLKDGIWKISYNDTLNNSDYIYASVWNAKTDGNITLDEDRHIEKHSTSKYNGKIYYRITVNDDVVWGSEEEGSNGWFSGAATDKYIGTWKKGVSINVKTGDVVRFEIKADMSPESEIAAFWSNPKFKFIDTRPINPTQTIINRIALLESEDRTEAYSIKQAYDALTDIEQNLVTNISVLESVLDSFINSDVKGDVNADNTCDILDLVCLYLVTTNEREPNNQSDLNFDGVVNADDLVLLRQLLLGIAN